MPDLRPRPPRRCSVAPSAAATRRSACSRWPVKAERARRLTVGVGALADGVDMAATLLAWKDLPRGGRLMILAVTVGATGLGVWSAAS